MRLSSKAALFTAVAAGTVLFGTGAAHAATGTGVNLNGNSHTCSADLWLTGSNQDYATATFSNAGGSGFTCVYWLERSEYTNGSWSGYTAIGSFGTNPDVLHDPGAAGGGGVQVDTGSYWDGPDYRVRACLYGYNNSEMTGNVCSSGI